MPRAGGGPSGGAAMSLPPEPTVQPGLAPALAAYAMWGFLPLYLLLVREVPAFEFVGWRIIFTLPVCLLIVALRRQGPDLRRALTDRRSLLVLCGSATLIGVNWFVYVWAIQRGEVLAASLGYYVNPLLNVLLGTLFLGERLTRRQWLAVALAGCGVALLLAGALTTLWISLALAGTFAFYGLLKKQVAVGSLPGLTIETVILLPLALAIVLHYAGAPVGPSFGQETGQSLAIALGGVVTAVPLLLFAVAARQLDYSVLGMVQFTAPTIVFVIGLTVFRQPLDWVQLACFAFIWAALALFVWDLLARRRAKLAG